MHVVISPEYDVYIFSVKQIKQVVETVPLP